MKRGSWAVLAVATSLLGACGDSAIESDEGTERIGEAQAGLTKGTPGAKVGDTDYCDDAANKCALGEGDCDSSTQCQSGFGLSCVTGNLAKRGPLTGDACAPAHCGNGIEDGNETSIDCGGSCGSDCTVTCDKPNGSSTKCSTDCPCSVGEGDCDGVTECETGLVCGSSNGPAFQLPAGTDVCWAGASCQNGVKDGTETAIDCGGSCAPCTPPVAGLAQVAQAGNALVPIVIAPSHATGAIHTEVQNIANELRGKLNDIIGTSGVQFAPVTTSATPIGISVGIHGDFAGSGWPYEGYFRPTEQTAGGVIRPDKLAEREHYVLRTPAGSNQVIVAGATLDALRHATWDLLKQAGYRHYFQTQAWEVVPSLPNLSFNLAIDEKPAFFARSFTFQRNLNHWDTTAGPPHTAEQNEWRKHNRLPLINEFDPAHTYASIMVWYGNQHGGAFPPALTTAPTGGSGSKQFCLSSTTAVGGQQVTALDAVREWALSQTNSTILAVSPNIGASWVSATSGSGLHCNDINDPTYSNIANRVAALANAAAEVAPGKVVTVKVPQEYATPTIALRQNVLVLVDYNYAGTPSFLLDSNITSWSASAHEVGVVDRIGGVSEEIPGRTMVSTRDLVERARRYHALGVQQYSADVNWGWGLPGPSVWAAAQALWDADAPLSGKAYRDDFLSRAFGTAESAARRYYDVLEGAPDPVPGGGFERPFWSENTLGVMYRALRDGFDASPGPAVEARLTDLAIYTRYLELYRTFWRPCSAQGSTTEQLEFKQLMQWLYSTRDRKMLRSRDVAARNMADIPGCPSGTTCTINGCLNNSTQQLTGAACAYPQWHVTCPSATPNAQCGSCTVATPGCNETKNAPDPDANAIQSLINAGVANNNVFDVGLIRHFSRDLVPYNLEPNTLPDRLQTLYTIGPHYFYFQKPSSSPLTAHIIKFGPNQILNGQLSLLNGGAVVDRRTFGGTPDMETDWVFPNAGSAVYRLDLDDQSGRMYTQFPEAGTRVAVPVGLTDAPLALNYRWMAYFFVPAGTTHVAGWAQSDGTFFRYTKNASGNWITPPAMGYLSDHAVGAACTSPHDIANGGRNGFWDHFVIPITPTPATDEIWFFNDGAAGTVGERHLFSVPPYLYRALDELLVPTGVVPPNPCPNGYDAQGNCNPPACVNGAACPTGNPECGPDNPCPAGMVCPEMENGWRYGQPGKFICEPPSCCSTPQEAGTTTPECGACPACPGDCSDKECGDPDLDNGCGRRCTAVCEPGQSGCQQDSDCTAGHVCRSGICVATDICARPNLAPPNCGPGSLCGPCPPVATPSCDDRVCGNDPVSGENCGTCLANQFCNAAGQCAGTDTTPPIEVPRDDGTPRPVIPPTAPNPPSLFGATQGSFAVSDRGSASYTIPIEIPPGRAGIEPALSIRYTSSTGNGALGVGWAVDGFSSISRCARSFAQDGYVRGIKGDTSDALCLDGQRLVADPQDPDIYRTTIDTFSKIVAVGNTSTGPESFKVYTKDGRILSFGSVESARNKLRDSVIGSWHLNREEDRVGNYYRVVYLPEDQTDSVTGEVSTSEMLPKAISYTGFQNSDGDREIVFEYAEDRNDWISGYRAGGGAFARQRLLTRIDVRAGNGLVRRYSFNYEDSPNGAVRMTSLQECTGTNASFCRNPTTFTYIDEEGFEPSQPKFIPLEYGRSTQPPIIPTGLVHKSEGGHDLLTVLVDHKTPQVVTPFPGGASAAMSMVPGIGTAASAMMNVINLLNADVRLRHNFETFTFDMLNGTRIVGSVPCPLGFGESDPPVRSVVGNGHYGAERVLDTCPKFRATPNPLPQIPGAPVQPPDLVYQYENRRWLIDLDGDGVQDTIYCAEDPPQSYDFGPMHLDYKLSNAVGTYDPEPYLGWSHADRDAELPVHGQICNPRARLEFTLGFDVDGDGTSNLLAFNPVVGWAALMPVDSGTGLEFEWRTDITAGLTFEPVEQYYVSVIDANGDGLRDLLGLPNPSAFEAGAGAGTTPRIAYNTGRGFREEALTPTLDGVAGQGGTFPKYGSHVVDLDQDGIEELVYPSPTAAGTAVPWRVGRVRDGQYRNEPIESLPGGFGVLGDFDGDGDIDAFTQALVYNPNPQKQGFRFHPGRGRRQNLLETVVDGLGHRVVVGYGATNAQGDVYTAFPNSDGSCVWPRRCMARVEHALVSEHVEMHFKNQARTIPVVDKLYAYNYQGAQVDTAGYGWLGFSEREVTVHDGFGGFLGSTRIRYHAPEVWTVGESSVPYVYLKAGLPEFREEVSPEVDSDISFSNEHRVEVQRFFEWTERTSASGQPFVFLSRTQVDTYERLLDFGITGMIAVTQEVGTTDVDDYGNPIDETTTRQDFQGVPPTASLDDTSLTVDQVTTTFDPTPAEIDEWLIALPKSRTETSDPRCDVPSGCPEKRRERTSTFTYHPDTDLTHVVTREPNDPILELTTVITRDDRGNATQIAATDAFGDVRETTTTYDSRGLFPETVTAVGDGESLTSQVRYDDRFGTLTSRADPNGIDETWGYDANGVARVHAGPGGVTTTDYFTSDYEFLPDGLEIVASSRIVTTKAGGESSEERLNAFGQIVSRTTFGFNGTPVHEEFEYDRRQRLSRQRRPHLPGDSSQGDNHLAYDEMNRLRSVEYPDGTEVLSEYSLKSSLDTDAAGPKVTGGHLYTRTTDQRGNVTVRAVTRDGQPLAVTDALGKRTTYHYAAFGHVESIADPAGRSIGFEHDVYGRTTSVTDQARGGTQTTSYNGFGQISGSLDAAGRAADYHYDGFGRLESLDDDDGTTTWIYGNDGENEIGRVIETTSAFGQRELFAYEPRGSTRNRGLLESVTHELQAIDAPPSVEARELTTRYHYDDYSRLEQVDYPASGGSPVSVGYDFDSYGHTIKAFNAATPSQVYWELVAADQGYRIGQERLGTHSCGGGQGTTTTRTYHAHTGLPHTIQTQCGSTVLQDLTYTYDPAGNLASRKTGSLHESFGHDALNRLTHRSAGIGIPLVQQYFYDEEGRGRMTSQSGVGAYSYQSEGRDWIHLAGPYTYAQDLVGNITSRSGPDVPGTTQAISYTAFDLPSQISSSAGQVDFSYDSSGTRVVKQSSSAATFYAGRFYQRSESSSSTDHRFMVFAGGRAIAQLNATQQGGSTSAPTVKYLHDDMLGSVNVVSSNAGAVSTTRTYSPFGKNFSAHAETPYGFTGHESDDELGLVNMRGRMYDPTLGQFLSADPMLQQPHGQGLNRFAYVNNSPLNATDPSGFACRSRAGRGCSAEIAPALQQAGTVIGIAGGVAAGAAAFQIGAGPEAILAGAGSGTGVGAASAGSSPGGAGAASPAAAPAGVGPGNIAAGVGSLITDTMLHAPRKTTSSDGGAPPRSAGGRTGGAPGRGAVAPDAIAPTQEPAPLIPSSGSSSSCPGACRKGDPKSGPGSHLKFDPEEYAYRLSDSAKRRLKPIFDHFGFDLGRISIAFGPTNGNQAFTINDSIVLNRDVWERFTPTQRIGLLAHEITHSVQYDRYSVITDFFARYFPEWAQGASNYEVPQKLTDIPIDKVNPRDTRFTLDQIAERVAAEATLGLPP